MDSIPLKSCLKCQQLKPLNSFGKDCRRADGLFPYCKACRQKNPAKIAESQANKDKGLKRCVTCRQWLAPSAFYNNRHHKDGLHTHCRECSIVQSRRYQENNADKVKKRSSLYEVARKEQKARNWQRYYKANADRLILKANQRRREYDPALDTLTGPEWKEIIQKQNGLCAKCKNRFTSKFVPTRDHILPLSQGGYLTKENTQALCRGCNASKGAKEIRF